MRAPIRIAVVALSLAVVGGGERSALAQDAGAPAAPDYPATNLAPGTCVGGGCHDSVKIDDQHKHAKGGEVTCVKCHSNVTDNKKPHKGTLDALPSPQMCAQSGCHAEAVKNAAAGPHKDSVCESCHDSVHAEFKARNYDNCSDCHEDQTKAFKESIHANVGPDKKPVHCDDCHGDLHFPKAKADPLAPMSKVMQVTTCGECHDKEYVRAYRTSVHGQGVLKSGLAVAPACVDCHGSHGMVKAKDPKSQVSREHITDTCGKCHTFIVARWKGSAHGRKWQEEMDVKKGDKKAEGPLSKTSEDHPKEAPVCTSCHTGHRTFDPMIYGNHLKMADRCAECHEKHSESYRDSFHGKATRLGYAPAATCANCHTPHEMLPTADPKASTNPKNLATTCGECHQPINDNFTNFDVHMNAHDVKRNAMVHYVWLFMTTLLIGVLMFFAFHTLLWLQRALVALSRHEIKHVGVPGEPWVRRFKPVHIWIHLTIVITFLTLSATGLPLKFSGVSWARPFEMIFGGIGNARWLHRAAGAVTFAYGGVFLAYLIREIVVRRRYSLLWGWQSMVPSLNDLKQLLANFRWFLYLGPPPRLDRWAYWEKFDFFAVFWGIPVIGFSGLALWMPLTVTSYLPGWVLNIAYLIHSDEALLATGFIFYFHLFHTHLRPEAFPLDTVVFLGGMPLSRFKAERPAEYERLEKSGELKAQLMPEPSEQAMKRTRTFGFSALAIGVLLGTFLIVSGLFTFLK